MPDKVITSSTPCDCCGDVPPSECTCGFLLGKTESGFFYELFADPFDNYADAVAGLAYVGDCYVFIDSFGGVVTVNSVTADVSVADQLTVTADNDNNGVILWASISVAGSGTLSIAFTSTFETFPYFEDKAFAELFDCATGASIASDVELGLSGTLTLTGFPAGTYFLRLETNALASAPLNATASFVVSSDVTMVTNPVIALWDDSGTTRQLEACPKLFLPPLTESTGLLYEDCAAANTVLTEPLAVDNCVGYNETFAASSAFSASDGGGVLNASVTATGESVVVWGSVNAVAGATLTEAYSGSVDTGTPLGGMAIFDDTGTLVEIVLDFFGSGSITSAPLPYTGRYTVQFGYGASGASTVNGTMAITSSGAMTVNPIQALYDSPLDCPSRLTCGDACP